MLIIFWYAIISNYIDYIQHRLEKNGALYNPILAAYCQMEWSECKLGNAYTLYDGEEAYYNQVGKSVCVSIIIALKERLLWKKTYVIPFLNIIFT